MIGLFLDSLWKAKLFSNFSTGNGSLFFKRLWNVKLSDRCHFIVTVFLALKEPLQQLLCVTTRVKINFFDKF